MNDDRIYRLGFSVFKGIGPLRFKLLKDYFGSAENAWKANIKDLLKINLGNNMAERFCIFRDKFSLDKYIKYLKEKNIEFLTVDDYLYPKLLKEINSPPFLIYYRGDLKNINGWDKCLAVVGTRNITSYGRKVTEKITQELVSCGLMIVSGMAYGVDTVAHETAIEHGGKTIAVLGAGIDVIHPKSNSTLYWKIIKKYGLVISEYPPGTIVEKGLFPARNRIISGLSLGIVVVEGASDSGALITARYAAEQGREVFAVPGPITSVTSQATNILLKNGARLVSSADDVLEELNLKTQMSNVKTKSQIPNLSLTQEEEIIVNLLRHDQLHFDELVRRSKIGAGKLASTLTLMEMKRFIKNLGGGVYGM